MGEKNEFHNKKNGVKAPAESISISARRRVDSSSISSCGVDSSSISSPRLLSSEAAAAFRMRMVSMMPLLLVFTCLSYAYVSRRPLFATNAIGIILPILSPFIHLRKFVPHDFEMRIAEWGAKSFLTPDKDFGGGGKTPPAPEYSDDNAWSALYPRADTADLKSRGWYGDDPSSEETISSQEDALCDLFYLPPTTFFSSSGWNAAFNDTEAQLMVDEAILFQQAAAFSSSCRIYSPRIRQMTAAGYFDPKNGEKALRLAYSDVERAFINFLQRRCKGENEDTCRRPIILASHSQGTTLMEKLLLQYFGPKNLGLQPLLVAAYLVGMEIHDGPYSWSGKDPEVHKQDADIAANRLYRDLLPLCESATQTGCVVAFRSFFSDSDVCDFLSRPVVSATRHRPRQRKVCVNPLTWTAMNSGTNTVGGNGVVGSADLALGCMPIIHPWANLHYLLFGQQDDESSVERLNGTISDIDLTCRFDAWCTENGMLRLEMPFSIRHWAAGFFVPFPAWTVFSFPGENTHAYDFNFFFNNIRKNAADRLSAWVSKYNDTEDN